MGVLEQNEGAGDGCDEGGSWEAAAVTKWCLGVLEDMVENEGIDDEVNALVEKSV